MTENKNINQTETGRSMVEMLGVLAIIGVLSVGGIAGYKMAMDKHKVNEIINGVGERAIVVSQKAIAGTTLSIPTEFGTKISGYTVELKDDVYDGAFRLTVSGVDKDICEKVMEAGLQSAFQISVDETVIWEQGEKTGTISCKDTGNSLVYDFDAALDQEVEAAEEETEFVCSTGTPKCGDQCCAEDEYCVQGSSSSTYTCVAASGSCSSTCTGEQVCAPTAGSCSGPTTMDCVSTALTKVAKGSEGQPGYEDYIRLPSGKTLTVYKGSGAVTWWAAKAICKENGKQMVSMSDLELADTGTNTTCYFRSSKSAFATKPCAVCEGDAGKTKCDAYDTELTSKLGSSYYWLADNSKSSSCYARLLNLGSGYVANYDRDTAGSTAVCK